MSEADRASRPSPPSPQQYFRLNLEQQKNRAKDLLRAVKAGDPAALARVAAQRRASLSPLKSTEELITTTKLADAQFTIARELRLPSWSQLKEHIERMERQRRAIDASLPAPDADLKTLHLRCGHDLQKPLKEAGFSGDFLVHANPYARGPLPNTPDYYERRGRFGFDRFARRLPERNLTVAGLIENFRGEDEAVVKSADDYERVVIWAEHDNTDQLMVVRCLSLYFNARPPRILELLRLNEFPGGMRFLGLGQLPPEALRLLWSTRQPVTPDMLAFGNRAWDALRLDDPGPLAAIARLQNAPVPDFPAVAHRHLQELPSVHNGLSLTEQLILQIVSEFDSVSLNQIFRLLSLEREPLFFIGDLGLLDAIEDMERVSDPPFVRSVGTPGEREFLNRLTITDAGRAVLAGERDWQSFNPPERWMGGIRIADGKPRWRWNESKREPVEMD
jgi:hypothetical protein